MKASGPESAFPLFVWTEEALSRPYVKRWYGSIRRQVSREFFLEVAESGALARKLIVTDVVNRKENPDGQSPNPMFDDLQYRSNSGPSSYMSLPASPPYRTSPPHVHPSYTYAHIINNQNNPPSR